MKRIDWAKEWGTTRSVTEYEKISAIGEGTYGIVFKAKDTRNGELVALKQVRMERERDTGMPITALREIKLLESLDHPNIVKLKEMAVGSKWDEIFLVFEYIDHDMADLMDSRTKPFVISEIKTLVKQLLEAVSYMHMQWVIHRDIKMSNLLYSHRGLLKVADFGLARTFTTTKETAMTPKVVTLWYRAPELLLGADVYSPAIDIWSVGCIFGELLQGTPILPGETEVDQLLRIYKLLGAPNEKIWPGYSSLPMVEKLNFPSSLQYNHLRSKFPDLQNEGLDLLNRLLTYDPRKRITAHEALMHPFFRTQPMPKHVDLMPTFPPVPRKAHKHRGDKSAEAEIVDTQPMSWPRADGQRRLGSAFGAAPTNSSTSSISSAMQVDFIRPSGGGSDGPSGYFY